MGRNKLAQPSLSVFNVVPPTDNSSKNSKTLLEFFVILIFVASFIPSLLFIFLIEISWIVKRLASKTLSLFHLRFESSRIVQVISCAEPITARMPFKQRKFEIARFSSLIALPSFSFNWMKCLERSRAILLKIQPTAWVSTNSLSCIAASRYFLQVVQFLVFRESTINFAFTFSFDSDSFHKT